MPSFRSLSAAVLGLVAVSSPLVQAQTYTNCNPTEKSDCPNDAGLNQASITTDFTSQSDDWTATAGTIKYGSNGAEFTVAKKGEAPTIKSNFYILFGSVEVEMKAAPGTGIISSVVLESDDLDEVDWEWLGGNDTVTETNYFGKGDTTTYDRAIYYPVSDPQDNWHTYTVDWTSDAIKWSIDGTVVRTLAYADAKGGSRFPQTPMNIRIGNWAGGDPSNPQGTIEWAGGETDYSKAPFTMYVKSVKIQNYTPADAYKFTDTSGSWQSVQPLNGTSTTSKSTNNNDNTNGNSNNVSGSGSGNSTSSSTSSSSSPSSSGTSTSSSSGSSSSGTSTTSGNSTASSNGTATPTPESGNAAPGTAVSQTLFSIVLAFALICALNL